MNGKVILVILSILIFIFLILIGYLIWDKNNIKIIAESQVSNIKISISNERFLIDKINSYYEGNSSLKKNIKNITILLVPNIQQEFTMENADKSIFMSYGSAIDDSQNLKIFIYISPNLLKEENSSQISERIGFLILRKIDLTLSPPKLTTNEFIVNEKNNFNKFIYVEKN